MLAAAMALAVPFAAAAPSAHARLLSPARGQQTSLEGVAGVQKLVLDRAALAALRARDSAVVRDFPLGRTRAADLVLSRFEPFRSEEHTSELQSPMYLVCRLLLEKKKIKLRNTH